MKERKGNKPKQKEKRDKATNERRKESKSK